jgi:peroxiredoxin
MLRRAVILTSLGILAGCSRQEAVPVAKAEATSGDLKFTDSEGRSCEPLAKDGRAATVLVFLMHDCPVANASAPALARLAADFEPRGMKFYGVYATETVAEINSHRQDYSLPFPGLMDPAQQLARRTGVSRIPETAVLSPSGELLYRGRIDDRAVSAGVTRPQPQRHDLRLALEAVLAGRKPDPQTTEAVGCYLPTL